MDDHRSADALTDTVLDRKLEAALAVDPSPEFGARVLRRVQRERAAVSSPRRWPIAATVACAAIIALVVALSRQDRAPVARDESLARQEPAAAPGTEDNGPGPVAQASTAGQAFRPAPTAAFRKSVRRQSRPSAVSGPELLIAADEARALRQLFSDVQRGLIDLSSLPEAAPASAALQPPSAIAFPPITFEPIAPAALEAGERQ